MAKLISNQSIAIDPEDEKRKSDDQMVDTNRTIRRDGSHLDASKEVRSLLEFLYLDVKVRSPAEIQDLTDQKLVQERVDLALIPTDKLIKDIRSSIEILLSIKNDNTNTANGGHMETLMMNDDSVADRTSMSNSQFNTFSARSTNPFEKAAKDNLIFGKEGPGATKDLKPGPGNDSIKSYTIFSEKDRRNLLGDRAHTELGSYFDINRKDSMMSDVSMTTQENCKAMEQQLQKYEGDIRKHISIEHQLQLFAEDLKRNITQLEKDKEHLEANKE